jgi:hypothetical protein
MKNQFRARILTAIRALIDTNPTLGIAQAADLIAREDHRRKVHEVCTTIILEVAQDLEPCESIDAYLRQHGSAVTPHQARLNWLADAIKRCATMPDKETA